MTTSTHKPAAVKTTVTRFDSSNLLRSDSFGIGLGASMADAATIAESVAEMTAPAVEVEMTDAEWDMQAEESMMRAAIEAGWAGHSLAPVAPATKPATIPATVKEAVLTENDGSKTVIRRNAKMGVWINIETGQGRLTDFAADDLYRKGLVIVVEAPKPQPPKPSRPKRVKADESSPDEWAKHDGFRWAIGPAPVAPQSAPSEADRAWWVAETLGKATEGFMVLGERRSYQTFHKPRPDRRSKTSKPRQTWEQSRDEEIERSRPAGSWRNTPEWDDHGHRAERFARQYANA